MLYPFFVLQSSLCGSDLNVTELSRDRPAQPRSINLHQENTQEDQLEESNLNLWRHLKGADARGVTFQCHHLQ